MGKEAVLNILLLILLYTALYNDLKYRKIPNYINFGGVTFGLILNSLYFGFDGFLLSVEGFFLGILIFIIPFVFGGMGGGDVKLVGAIGAIKGPLFIFWAAIFCAITGGLIAVLIMIRKKSLIHNLKKIFTGIYNLVFFKTPTGLDMSEGGEGTFPYALAIGAGTLLALFLQMRGALR